MSYGFAVSGNAARPLTLERVERWLGEGPVAWHVGLLATAPEPENPEPVRSVLRHAESFAWTNLEVEAVAGVLFDAGAISEEEYGWLRETVGGPGYGGRTRPGKVCEREEDRRGGDR